MPYENYNLASYISNKMYDTGSDILSGIWWATKETCKQTIKIAIPSLITLMIIRKTGLLDQNHKKEILSLISSPNPK